MRIDVNFPGARGITLRGWLFLPDAGAEAVAGSGTVAGPVPPAGPWPAVVMAHGFSATRHMCLEGFAEAMAAAGIAALVYDHAHLGDSDGEPRQIINPWAQARDYRKAMDWLAARDDIDPERLAIWGSSYSGGEVLVVAAVDPRVKAVVASVPFGALPNVDYDDSAAVARRFAALRDALLDESGSGPADSSDEPFGPLRVVDGPAPRGAEEARVFLPQEESTEWFLRVGGAPGTGWRNVVWLRAGFGTEPAWDPGVAAMHLHVPSLWIVATRDALAATDVTLQSFARAPEDGPGEGKQLELIEGHHFTPYEGEAFTRASAVTVAFLQRVLYATASSEG
jgi:hypothetical protein